MKIQNSHLKALLSVCENDKTREYVNQICVNKEMAYASNGYIAMCAVVSENNSEERKTFKASAVNLEAAIQESRLKYSSDMSADVKKSLITLDGVEAEQKQFPPIETIFSTAEEQENMISACYDLNMLIDLLQAIKKSCVEKNQKRITIHIGNAHKPMLIKSNSGVCGIIVPVKF